MSVVLLGRERPDPFRLNSLQIQLVASTLQALGVPDRDLFAPHAYVPSHVCSAWSSALLEGLPDLVLLEVWDPVRAHLRPRGVVRAPVSLQRGKRNRGGDPWAGLPPRAERTPVGSTTFGALLISLATWLGTCGGASLEPGQR